MSETESDPLQPTLLPPVGPQLVHTVVSPLVTHSSHQLTIQPLNLTLPHTRVSGLLYLNHSAAVPRHIQQAAGALPAHCSWPWMLGSPKSSCPQSWCQGGSLPAVQMALHMV